MNLSENLNKYIVNLPENWNVHAVSLTENSKVHSESERIFEQVQSEPNRKFEQAHSVPKRKSELVLPAATAQIQGTELDAEGLCVSSADCDFDAPCLWPDLKTLMVYWHPCPAEITTRVITTCQAVTFSSARMRNTYQLQSVVTEKTLK